MSHALTLTAALALQASPTTTWELDPGHSQLEFKVRHMMVSWTRGKFDAFRGTLELDEQDLARSRVEVTIDARTVDSNLEKRDEHLRSPDFLDVERFPAITFRSTRFRPVPDGLEVEGELTLRGVTRPVTLHGEPLSPPVLDPWGTLRRGTRATARLSRKDFGLTWNAALEAGGVAVGDQVELTLDVEFTRPAPGR